MLIDWAFGVSSCFFVRGCTVGIGPDPVENAEFFSAPVSIGGGSGLIASCVNFVGEALVFATPDPVSVASENAAA
jgi:hypothetical protein